METPQEALAVLDKLKYHVCAEVQYENADGNVHSDICFNHDVTALQMAAQRTLLHAALDEWLNKGNYTGWFVVGKTELIKDVLDEYDVVFQE